MTDFALLPSASIGICFSNDFWISVILFVILIGCVWYCCLGNLKGLLKKPITCMCIVGCSVDMKP